MKKAYKFLELNKKAQNFAIKDYIKGWEETHDKGDMTFEEVKEILTDNNDDDEFLYTSKGEIYESN